MIEKDLAAARAAFTTLVEKDVPAFNRTFKGSGRIAVGALQ
jgi:hypothetical protein